jgi:large subunit ribosomal protein L18e
MPRPTGPTNPVLEGLIEEIRSLGYKEKSNFLIRLAELLEKPTRRKAEVNLSKLNRICKENETIVVPGKVLDGLLSKPVTVAAVNFSHKARINIEKAGGKVLSIRELVHKDPKGSKVRIVT